MNEEETPVAGSLIHQMEVEFERRFKQGIREDDRSNFNHGSDMRADKRLSEGSNTEPEFRQPNIEEVEVFGRRACYDD